MERDFRLNWPLLVEEAVRRRRRLNLSQQQLADLAKVSTPTVSRFEQAEKNLQLSTVLAVLEVLGMTDKQTLSFPDREFRIDVADGVTFYGQDSEKRVRSRVSREALEDHFSVRNRLRPEAAFKKHRAEIESFVRRKYALGQTEPDGSVLIRTLDLV
jgi:transcriptional regulator with XRE-family HTH domain